MFKYFSRLMYETQEVLFDSPSIQVWSPVSTHSTKVVCIIDSLIDGEAVCIYKSDIKGLIAVLNAIHAAQPTDDDSRDCDENNSGVTL